MHHTPEEVEEITRESKAKLDAVQSAVLLVDDQFIFGERIKNIISQHDNISFYYCQDPGKALDMAKDNQVTVILLDILMPDISGFEVLSRLRRDKFTQRIPVIMLSSEDCPDMKHEAFAYYANDYMVKSPDPIELIARIRSHTRNYLMLLELDRTLKENMIMRMQLDRINRELRDSNAELEKISNTDKLTGIANRRYFDVFLKEAMGHIRRSQDYLSLILMDVDHFKPFNDNYGHQAGDECLRQIGAMLKKNIGRQGELAARYGGEEFAIILTSCDIEAAGHVAERVRLAVLDLKIPHQYSHSAEIVSVSIGLVQTSGPSRQSCEELIEAADTALYKAKKSGRNCICLAD